MKNIWNLFGLLWKDTPYLRGCKYCQHVVENAGMNVAHNEYERCYYSVYENNFDRGYRDTLSHYSNLIKEELYVC